MPLVPALRAVLTGARGGARGGAQGSEKISLGTVKGIAMLRKRKEGIGREAFVAALERGRKEKERERVAVEALGAVARQEMGEGGVAGGGVAGGVLAGAYVPHPDHPPSRLFGHFDADNDGLLSEKEVAALLKQLTRKRKDEEAAKAAAEHKREAGLHDISIDGETLSVGDGDFDLLFKQLSNLKQTKDPSKDPRMTLQEDIVFVKDLVIVFFAATIGGVLAINLGQPALIGFLLGGMTVGPGGLGIVTELVEVETLASLGIAFLLFSLGIEFSITELQGVRRVVVVGGVVSMFAIVVGTGLLSVMLSLVKTVPEAIALGLAVSLSSTAVVLQCLPTEANVATGATAIEEKAALARSAASVATTRGSTGAGNGAGGGGGGDGRARNGAHHRVSPGGSAVMGGGTAELLPSLDAQALSGGQTRDDHVVSLADVEMDLKGGSSGGMGDGGGSGVGAMGGALGTGISFDAPRSRKVMLGLLVFQDVMIGLILALLPTLQGSLGQFVEELLSALLRLGCFVVLCLILSEFVLPTVADRVERARSQEVFTMGCVVFCLAMAYLSEKMGLAIELGAFAAGIMLSESRHKGRVEESVEGIKSLFSAVFFISVGMMIHWRYFYMNLGKMLVLAVVVLSVKAAVFAIVIYALGGLPMRVSIACGAAIAQAGEFTFVIASKGQALLLFSAAEARMINGATALSMLVTPYLIRYFRLWSQRGASR